MSHPSATGSSEVANGFLASFKKLLELTIPVPHYSTLARRAAGLVVPQISRASGIGPLHLAIGSPSDQTRRPQEPAPDRIRGFGRGRVENMASRQGQAPLAMVSRTNGETMARLAQAASGGRYHNGRSPPPLALEPMVHQCRLLGPMADNGSPWRMR